MTSHPHQPRDCIICLQTLVGISNSSSTETDTWYAVETVHRRPSDILLPSTPSSTLQALQLLVDASDCILQTLNSRRVQTTQQRRLKFERNILRGVYWCLPYPPPSIYYRFCFGKFLHSPRQWKCIIVRWNHLQYLCLTVAPWLKTTPDADRRPTNPFTNLDHHHRG